MTETALLLAQAAPAIPALPTSPVGMSADHLLIFIAGAAYVLKPLVQWLLGRWDEARKSAQSAVVAAQQSPPSLTDAIVNGLPCISHGEAIAKLVQGAADVDRRLTELREWLKEANRKLDELMKKGG